MRKRQFLAPLAVSVAALWGGGLCPVEASDRTGASGSETSTALVTDHFVLGRSHAGEVKFADHESHASHASHESHASGM